MAIDLITTKNKKELNWKKKKFNAQKVESNHERWKFCNFEGYTLATRAHLGIWKTSQHNNIDRLADILILANLKRILTVHLIFVYKRQTYTYQFLYSYCIVAYRKDNEKMVYNKILLPL